MAAFNETQLVMLQDRIRTALFLLDLNVSPANRITILNAFLKDFGNIQRFINDLPIADFLIHRMLLTHFYVLFSGREATIDGATRAIVHVPQTVALNMHLIGPPVTAAQIAATTRSSIIDILPEYNTLLAILEDILPINQANPAPPAIPLSEFQRCMIKVLNFMTSIGIGIGRFVWRPIKGLIGVFTGETLCNLGTLIWRLFTEPFELCCGVWESLHNYAVTEPVEFWTEVLLNVALLALPTMLKGSGGSAPVPPGTNMAPLPRLPTLRAAPIRRVVPTVVPPPLVLPLGAAPAAIGANDAIAGIAVAVGAVGTVMVDGRTNDVQELKEVIDMVRSRLVSGKATAAAAADKKAFSGKGKNQATTDLSDEILIKSIRTHLVKNFLRRNPLDSVIVSSL